MRKRSKPTDYKTALVTGASSGIGAATTLKLAAQGLKVFLIARRVDRLSTLADKITTTGGEAEIIPADLTIESDRNQVYQNAMKSSNGIDVLVNNAGLGWYGFYEQMPWDISAQLMEVNMTAVAHLTSLFLPQMHQNNRGHIINVGSIAGSFPNQGVALYSASKSFLDSFTTVLHRELQGTDVRCSVVRAGPVSSEFYTQAENRAGSLHLPAGRFAISSQVVADRIWNLLNHPKKVVYVPRIMAVTRWIEIFFGGIIDRLGPLLLKRAATDNANTLH